MSWSHPLHAGGIFCDVYMRLRGRREGTFVLTFRKCGGSRFLQSYCGQEKVIVDKKWS